MIVLQGDLNRSGHIHSTIQKFNFKWTTWNLRSDGYMCIYESRHIYIYIKYIIIYTYHIYNIYIYIYYILLETNISSFFKVLLSRWFSAFPFRWDMDKPFPGGKKIHICGIPKFGKASQQGNNWTHFAIFALFKEEFQLLVLCQRLTVLALSSGWCIFNVYFPLGWKTFCSMMYVTAIDI